MPKQIDPIRKIKLKQAILKGKTKADALRIAGYSESTAKHEVGRNTTLKYVEAEIIKELTEKDITVELIINRLNQDRSLALAKQDYATATRVDELLGKYLAMFTDKAEVKTESIEHKTEIDNLLSKRYNAK